MKKPNLKKGFTRISNEVIEELLKVGLNGTEWAVVMFVLRKTYGWQKKEDAISLSQFTENIPVSKRSICTALDRLKVVKILSLVMKGSPRGNPSCWAFNKNYKKWQVVKKTSLVKKIAKGSEVLRKKVVKKTSHTKETFTKEKQKKERVEKSPSQIVQNFLIAQELKNEDYNLFLESLSEKYFLEKSVLSAELDKFTNHWCELNHSGKKQKWQMERTFELRRRITKWILNYHKFKKTPQKNESQMVEIF